MISSTSQESTQSHRVDRYDSQLPPATASWFEGMESAYPGVRFSVRSTWPAGQATCLTGREKREREFLMGRRCAAQLLSDRGISSPVEVNRDRSPIWPARSVGSISHSDRWTLACVASAETVRSVGIDTEPVIMTETSSLIERDVATADEIQLLTTLGFESSSALTLIFSAKESFYKCWYPITKQFLEFQDVLVVSATDSSLTLRRINASLWGESELTIHYDLSNDDVFTFAILEGDQ